MRTIVGAAVLAVIGLSLPNVASASPVNGTGLITPNVLYGSGNANGSFTGETSNGVEVGLRAHQRFPAADLYNYDGSNTYVFDPTASTPANRSVFNFDWSVDIEGAGGNLGDYSYVLSVDQDQSAAVSYATFDPLALATYYDHSLGTSSTPNGGGVESTSNAELLSNILLYTVMQQSTNLGFGFSANPHSAGIFNIKFEVFDKTATTLLSSAEIVVQVVPLPAALPMFGAGLGLLLMMRYRRRRAGSAIAA